MKLEFPFLRFMDAGELKKEKRTSESTHGTNWNKSNIRFMGTLYR